MSEQPPDEPDEIDPEKRAEQIQAWRAAAVRWRDDPDMAAQRSSEKQRLLTEALERGKTQVRLDARRAGCRVPEHLADELQLVLNLSWRFAHTDMVVNERGLAATLRFGGQPFRCVVPWRALWGVLAPGAEELRIWPVDLPEEMGGPTAPVDEVEPPPVEPVKPRLSVLGLADQASAGFQAPSARHEREPGTALRPVEDASAFDLPASDAPPSDSPPHDPSPPEGRTRAPWLRVVK